MPIHILSILNCAITGARQLYGNAKATEAMEVLLHNVEQQSAAISRVETDLTRLANAPFMLGLAHLDDANATTRTNEDRLAFLLRARESFKGGAESATDPLIRSASALFCALCWVESNSIDDGVRWAEKAYDIANENLGDMASLTPPPQPPVKGIRRRLWRMFIASDVALMQEEVKSKLPWLESRLANMKSLLLMANNSACLAAKLNPQRPPKNDLFLFPNCLGSDYDTKPLILESVPAGGYIQAGTAQFRLEIDGDLEWRHDRLSYGIIWVKFHVLSGSFKRRGFDFNLISTGGDNVHHEAGKPEEICWKNLSISCSSLSCTVSEGCSDIVSFNLTYPGQNIGIIFLVNAHRGYWQPATCRKGEPLPYIKRDPPENPPEDDWYDPFKGQVGIY
jgi:hypothetical protein